MGRPWWARRAIGRRLSTVAVVAAVIAVLLIAYEAQVLQPAQQSTQNPIQHVIVVMQENRTFDNYFWTYPGQVGYNASLCMPLNPRQPSAGCMKPRLATSTALSGDLPHDYVSTGVALQNGSMNGFLAAAKDNPNVMTYYDSGALPNLWSYAQHYVLADEFFSSAKSYSQPNHWYMIAGNSPQVSVFQGQAQEQKDCYDAKTHSLTMSTCAYINEAQEIQTIADEMNQNGVSWKYYDTPIPAGATLAEAVSGNCHGCNAYAYWNPLQAKNSTYMDPAYTGKMAPRSQLLRDIGNGTLPQVSWVIPSAPISDHPPANVALGMWWITDVLNAVMGSQYWKNTAVFVLWDDYGGFFDTVAPPTVDGYGLSFRCPALFISAYVKPGLDHTTYSFESTLKFIEWRFNLPSLTGRDASANNVLDAFNFTQSPLAPDIIPLTQAQLAAIRPYVLQGTISNPNPNGNGTSALAFLNNDPD